MIEYTLALVYQKDRLVMSKHAEILFQTYSYPVIELYLDTDRIEDPEQTRTVEAF